MCLIRALLRADPNAMHGGGQQNRLMTLKSKGVHAVPLHTTRTTAPERSPTRRNPKHASTDGTGGTDGTYGTDGSDDVGGALPK